jgi:hypothetical protein
VEQIVTDLINRCRAEMLADANFVLSFATRRALLRALGPLLLEDHGYGRQLGPGKRRRTELAWRCANEVAPAWEAAFQSPAARNINAQIRAYLDGQLGADAVEKSADALQGALFNDPQGKDEGYLAGRAACAAAWVAVGDEMLVPDAGCTQEQLDHPEDPDLWDCAFFAAASHAKGIPGTANFDKDRMLAFWEWYLGVAVPKVCEAVDLAEGS